MLKRITCIVAIMVIITTVLIPATTVRAETYNDIIYEPIDIESIIDNTTEVYYTSLGEAYLALNNSQKEIVMYLIGLYNYMYMGARGFKYSGINSDVEMQARFKALGNRIIYGDGFFGWVSRANETFRQYMSAIIIYASNVKHVSGREVTFSEWWNNIVHGAHDLYIPYTDDALDAWNFFYEDNSIDGITSFGEWETEWESGVYYDFEFGNYPFASGQAQNYNDFIINYSPVIFGPVYDDTGNNSKAQYVISLQNLDPFDSLYLLRGAGGDYFTAFRFGYSNRIGQSLNVVGKQLNYLNRYNEIYVGDVNRVMSTAIYDIGVGYTLRNAIELAFYLTPFNVGNDNVNPRFYGCYPFIEHVYLVDDLNTLANKEELLPTETLDITGGRTGWIMETTNGNWYYFDGDPDYTDSDLITNSYKPDDNGDLVPVTSDDIKQTIINNTTIQNYFTVTPGTVINVPSDWFSRGDTYLDVVWYYTEPVIMFVAATFNSLGDIKLVLLGCFILGLAGGVVGKFLL